MRPRLRPALARLWRDRASLQLGLDPATAVMLTGLDPGTAQVVDRIDGTRTPAELADQAVALGTTPARVRELLRVLADGGLIEDADAARVRPGDPRAPDRASASLLRREPDGGAGVLARRATAAVIVYGGGRVGSATAALLAAAGVGTVEVVDRRPSTPSDATPAGVVWNGDRRKRDAAARDALRRTAPAVRCVLPRGRTPDAAVIVAEGRPAPRLAAQLSTHGVPHVFADTRETTGVVGPFVQPGLTPCSRCLDLHRRDRDPAWPRLLTQLAAVEPSPHRACDTVLATAVAATTALQVLMHLDGDTPTTQGATIEIPLPDAHPHRRTWHPHPSCPCGSFEASEATRPLAEVG
ncbi:TOMM precursor leader peptide-binding protein [Yinghuangia aomiensis]